MNYQNQKSFPKPEKIGKNQTKLGRRRVLRLVGISDSTQLKKQIQAKLRELVILRDGGCWLRHFPESGKCGGFRNDGALILQGEHLNTRSSGRSFADSRLVVCICQRHHIYWKPQFSSKYNELAEKFIGTKRTKLWHQVRDDKSPHKADLKLELLALTQEVEKLKKHAT